MFSNLSRFTKGAWNWNPQAIAVDTGNYAYASRSSCHWSPFCIYSCKSSCPGHHCSTSDLRNLKRERTESKKIRSAQRNCLELPSPNNGIYAGQDAQTAHFGWRSGSWKPLTERKFVVFADLCFRCIFFHVWYILVWVACRWPRWILTFLAAGHNEITGQTALHDLTRTVL